MQRGIHPLVDIVSESVEEARDMRAQVTRWCMA